MRLLSAIATVGGYTLASRALGFVRDILIAAFLGAGPVADAFFVAFKLPNFFRRLFAEGAFSAAFVPLFTRILTEDGTDAARRFSERALSVLAAVLLVFCTAMQIAMPWAMYLFAPGFASDPAKFDLAVELARIAFPYLLFISLVSQLGGVLNALDRFAAAAAAPILLNLSLILCLIGLAPILETPGHALAWGVFAAGVIQFLWLIEACRRAGMVFRLPRPRLTPAVRRLVAKIVPGAIGAGVQQINLVIGVILASLLPTGAVSYLYYADRVYQLPLGVIGIAVGTALLPLLSRQIREGDEAGGRESFNRALEFSLLLTLPAAAALMVMPGPIVALLFERGAFDARSTAATAAALAAFAAGLPAFVLVKVLAPGFFAREDVTTPVKIAGVSVAANIALSVILLGPLQHVGLALATSAASWLNAFLLAFVLHRRGQFAIDRRLRTRLFRIVLATFAMTAILLAGLEVLATMLAGTPLERGLAVVVLIVAGKAAYAAAAFTLGAAEFSEIRGSLSRRKA
ncbi:MAG: murein biosynthesis integral membrane protein MurJ [Defluviicoccus sp.]|nr:murein biosynthesis integral membrane protein MurJ [Defluviicoccus sp.]